MAKLSAHGGDRADAMTSDAHKTAPKPQRSFVAKLVVRIPYAWLVAFFLVPFLIVLKISLSQTAIAQPPYAPVFEFSAGWHGIRSFFAGLSLDNYVFLVSDPLYALSYV